jgi:YVTN family beta-propeller protein
MKLAHAMPTCLLLAACMFAGRGMLAATEYLGPVAVVASRDGGTLFVAGADGRRVTVVRTADHKVVGSIDMPFPPTSLAISGDGKRLYVACAAPESTVCVVDTGSCKVVGSLPAGHTATGLALMPDGKQLYVCNRFNNDVSVIDLQSAKAIARVPVVREPVAAVATSDGRSVFVINQLPLDRADGGAVAAVVTVIDPCGAGVSSAVTTTIRLPNGSSSVRAACLSPDGKQLYLTHGLSRYQTPTTQVERGWMNTNALSVIDVAAKKLLNTVLLDDVDLGVANPWGVAMTADGRHLCVAHAGTQKLSIIDAAGLLDRLMKLAASSKSGANGAAPQDAAGSATVADVPNDLSFLVGLRRRVHLQGQGPRGLAIVGSAAYVAEYFSDTLATVDLATGAVGQIALGPKPQPSLVRRGQMLFQNADLCFQHWQSCETCHPDARADGLNWDLLNDGIGNPKNTRSMLLTQRGGPAMALGVRETSQAAVRAGIAHIQFAVRPEEEAKAIDEYLKSLRAIPSPHLVGGRLSPAAQRGQKIFFAPNVGCARCHPEPTYSDGQSHDVGSAGPYDRPGDKFNTPSLIEAWRTAPYMHDGHYLTIKELIVQGKHGGKGDVLGHLTEQQIDDLVAFLLSL